MSYKCRLHTTTVPVAHVAIVLYHNLKRLYLVCATLVSNEMFWVFHDIEGSSVSLKIISSCTNLHVQECSSFGFWGNLQGDVEFGTMFEKARCL